MANLMSMLRLNNRVNRDGYDLSKSVAFTAKPGEFLPIYSRYLMPGDKFNIDGTWRTRVAPLETSAFTSFKEYYDWYFVPIDILWNKFNVWFTNLKDNMQSATSIFGNTPLSDDHPYFTVGDLDVVVNGLKNVSEGGVNEFGFLRYELTCKLLHYLGYGDYYSDNGLSRHIVNARLSPWRLLAYQCIYQHHIRYQQWEVSCPETYNIDYISGTDEDLHIPIRDLALSGQPYANGKGTSMLDLRYVNWNKDMFMGLLPNAQYGDTASIDLSSLLTPVATGNSLTITANTTGDMTVGTNKNVFIGDLQGQFGFTQVGVSKIAESLGFTPERLQSAFTILALRQAEALQKYKEIKQSNDHDFPSQVDAHFGVRPNSAYSRVPMHITGWDTVIGINDVDNTNLTDNADGSINEARIAGKALARGNGKRINFSTDVPGILMCCYHVKPILDYALPRLDPDNLKTRFTDYPLPEFDRTGMQQIPVAWLTNRIPVDGDPSLDFSDGLLGYAPPYLDCKTDIDEVKGAFYNGGLEHWVAPITADYASNWFDYQRQSVDFRGLTSTFFKVNPRVLDSLFIQAMDDYVSSDKFWVQLHLDIGAVRPLDRQGLPY